MCSFTRIDWKNDYGHIGLVTVNPEKQSRGIGSAMLRQLMGVGFNEYHFRRIDLVVIQSNRSAYNFYTQKLGFTDEGLIRDIIKTRDGYLSWYCLSLLSDECR